jgi:hypothetical protein
MIEQYTQTPPITEYLVVDELTVLVDLQRWVWVFVTVENIQGILYVSGTELSVGMRVGRDGSVFPSTPPGMQLLTITANPVYEIGQGS